MEPDTDNMTLNEYLMYEGRHRDLDRSCTFRNRFACSKIAHVNCIILVYPDSNEEDKEYCMLPPLPPYFQTPQPCTKFNSISYNVENEVDVDNMTVEEYDLYMAIQSLMKSEIQVDENIDISIAREIEEVRVEDVEMDENHDVDHSKTKEALQWSLAKDPFLVLMETKDHSLEYHSRDITRPASGHALEVFKKALLHKLNATVIPTKVDARGVVLAARKPFKPE
ncbi:hypothetical protein Tco_0670292 [Tanacetum coccineum]